VKVRGKENMSTHSDHSRSSVVPHIFVLEHAVPIEGHRTALGTMFAGLAS
jgi:hypothetical protein